MELDRLEDALEQRYIELEQGVGSLSNETYEAILQELEVEQRRLQRQRERVQVQWSYSLCRGCPAGLRLLTKRVAQAEFHARCMAIREQQPGRSPMRVRNITAASFRECCTQRLTGHACA